MNLGNTIPTRTLAKRSFPVPMKVLCGRSDGGWAVVTSKRHQLGFESLIAQLEPEKLAAIRAFMDRDGAWTAALEARPHAVILDSALEPLETIDLPAEWTTADAISNDRRWLAFSDVAAFRLLDRMTGRSSAIAHERWSAWTGSGCFFDAENRFWCVVPRVDRTGDDSLLVSDPAAGTVLDRVPFRNGLGFASFGNGPSPGTRILEISCGQDSCDHFLIAGPVPGVTLRRLPLIGRTAVCFSPERREFVTGSHEGFAACVHSWPACEEIATLAKEDLFAVDREIKDDAVGYCAVYLDAEHLLIDTQRKRFVVIRRCDMKVLGTLWPEGYEVIAQSLPGGIMHEGNAGIVECVGDGKVLFGVGEQNTLVLADCSAACIS
jgi:hypothetical protein